ncbi:MAG: tetraacyldisaccharide 4'-kinase [Gammaproteobacteria bacterium]|nr:tetraacyldisaccharide 4'-kinase [Gammaproteobacteria bacterium]
MGTRLDSMWYGKSALSVLLAPVSWLYCAGMRARSAAYHSGLFASGRVGVPVIVVGNLSVGGTGKTPLVVWITRYLESQGLRPGVVCRGYRGRAQKWPQQVRADSDPIMVGDEPVLIARTSGCPVAADPDRLRAARTLVSHVECDVLVSDDGLQHLAMGRDVEIAVIDGTRRHGNGRCLPAGPLREPVSRLDSVDLVVVNGAALGNEFGMRLVTMPAESLPQASITRPLERFVGEPVHAVCGIGAPQRFFDTLEQAGLTLIRHPFPDHHDFRAGDIVFDDSLAVLMTEKDAVKCRRFADSRHWCVPVRAELPADFGVRLMSLLGVRARSVSES